MQGLGSSRKTPPRAFKRKLGHTLIWHEDCLLCKTKHGANCHNVTNSASLETRGVSLESDKKRHITARALQGKKTTK